MNKRIQELAEQADPCLYERCAGDGFYFDYEKFAELIVIECAKIASDSVIDHSGHSETNICPKYLGYKIKDHFGVEE